MSGVYGFPFTSSEWQELEHQILFFKYMNLGIPIPPDLLLALNLKPGWSCFHVGAGRKIDPEPGRCRRSDGKKWRCSKEAFPDSKYCERHMHRGKNRSRKSVEVPIQPAEMKSSNTLGSYPRSLYSHVQETRALSRHYDQRSKSFVYGLKEEKGDTSFFSAVDGSLRLPPLSTGSGSVGREEKGEKKEERTKTIHHFFDEWPGDTDE